MTSIGTITGLGDEVARQRTAWTEAAATAKKDLEKDLETKTDGLSFALVGWFPPTYYVATPANPSPLIKVGLEIGLTLPGDAAEPGASRSDWLELSEERIDETPADILYWGTSLGDPTSLKLWPRQPAVKAKQAYKLDIPPIGWSYHEYNRTLKILKDSIPTSRADTVTD